MEVRATFPEDVREYALAAKRVAELTLELLEGRYGHTVKRVELRFLKTGRLNFYARPGLVVVEYYDGAFDVEPTYCEGIGERLPSSPYLIAHEVCHNAFGFCTYEGLAEALSTVVCRELGDEFRELWPTRIKVREYAEFRHEAITSIDFERREHKGLHFAGTYMFLLALEGSIGGSAVGGALGRVRERWGEISQPDFVVEVCESWPEGRELLEAYGDASMYPLAFWRHSRGWLSWMAELFREAFEKHSVSEAVQLVRSRVYSPLAMRETLGSLTERLANWLQALGYRFRVRHYDGRRAELAIVGCSPALRSAAGRAACEACRGVFALSSPGVAVGVARSGERCVLTINRRGRPGQAQAPHH